MTTPKNQKPAAAKAAPAKKEQITGDMPGLWIEAISEQGRFRAGHHWTREGMGIALKGLTEEKIAALKSDPMLRVKEVVFSDEEKPGVIGYIDPESVDLDSDELDVMDDPDANAVDPSPAPDAADTAKGNE